MAAPKPPPRWSKAPTGQHKAPSAAAPVARIMASRPARRRWPWIALGLVVVGGVVAAVATIATTSVDRPPSGDARLDDHHTAKWDDRKAEQFDGLIGIEEGRTTITLHFAPGADEIVYRLTGKLATELRRGLEKTSAIDGNELKRAYLKRVYRRASGPLRTGWKINSFEEIDEGAEDVAIACPSRLYAHVELRVAPVECRDPAHTPRAGLKPCERVREAWVAKIVSVEELK